jgi:hypothetical protein
VEQIGLEGGEILKPPVTMQMVEAMAEKRNQAQGQCQQAIRVTMSVLGACWRKPILGENQGSFEEIKEEIRKIRQIT